MRSDRSGEICPTCGKGTLEPTKVGQGAPTDSKGNFLPESQGGKLICTNPDCGALHPDIKAEILSKATAHVETEFSKKGDSV